jgi:DNA-directed RNA polymerase subunit RPC12/RpoP
MTAAIAPERRFPCGQCGAKLEFAPGRSALTCPYCGFVNPIARPVEPVEEQDFHAALAALERAAPTERHTTLKCDACGALTDKPADITSTACPFCGSNIVASEATESRIRPGAVLPFQVRREQADGLFREWLGRLWFAPSKLRRFAAQERRLSGMYVPCWTYDCRTTSHYTGQRGDNYTVTVTVYVNGKPVTRTEVRTRWTPVSGVVENAFDDVLVIASHSLPRKYAEKLEPWDLERLVPYADEYLSGFRAESYQVGLAEGFEVARGIMQGTIEQTIRADIGGDHQQISSVRTTYRDITFKHILLPVWLSAYRYRDKVYRFLVNARTGEVQGERPYSAWKIAGFVLTLLAIAGTVALIVSQRSG